MKDICKTEDNLQIMYSYFNVQTGIQNYKQCKLVKRTTQYIRVESFFPYLSFTLSSKNNHLHQWKKPVNICQLYFIS